MLEILKFMCSGFWTWLGCFILFAWAIMGILMIISELFDFIYKLIKK